MAEKGLKKKIPNGEEEVICREKKEAEKVVKLKLLNSTEEEGMVLTETQHNSCFKPKLGNVFPAKRKSVKRMMFDQIMFHCRRPSPTAVASQAPQG